MKNDGVLMKISSFLSKKLSSDDDLKAREQEPKKKGTRKPRPFSIIVSKSEKYLMKQTRSWSIVTLLVRAVF